MITVNVRLLLLALTLLALHSTWLWWSLTPSAGAGQEQAEASAQALQLASSLPEQPGGDLFVPGRQRNDEAAEPAEQPEAPAAPYTLQAVLAVGAQHQALFSNGTQLLKLATNDMVPGRGRIDRIERHAVALTNEQGETERLQLFPTSLNSPPGGEKGNSEHE